MNTKPLFLRWALINVLFVVGLIVARIAYKGHIPFVAYVAIGIVLLTYGIASVTLGLETWREDRRWYVDVPFVGEAIRLLPMMAMLGTVSGFLIALTGDPNQVAHRISGAATALSATFIGIAATILLKVQHYLLTNRES